MFPLYLYFSVTYNKHLIYKMEATEIYRVQTFQVYEHLIDYTQANLSRFVLFSAMATKHTVTWECVCFYNSVPLRICIHFFPVRCGFFSLSVSGKMISLKEI